ncbi:MAG: hypothetical protein WBC51_26605 [Vicinamibacterales bacterium]|jgi:hypothetical protein
MESKGKWTGKLLDASGRVGKIEMDVGAEGGRGAFTLELQERDGRPVTLKGPITLTTEGETYRLRSSPGTEQERGRGEWQATLSRGDSGRYAKAAMMGTYGVSGGGPELPLTGGVVILWQFS